MIKCDIFNQYIQCVVTMYCTHQLTERKRKVSCTKLPMRNGMCENRLCARAPRARQGSCIIWYESIPR